MAARELTLPRRTRGGGGKLLVYDIPPRVQVLGPELQLHLDRRRPPVGNIYFTFISNERPPDSQVTQSLRPEEQTPSARARLQPELEERARQRRSGRTLTC